MEIMRHKIPVPIIENRHPIKPINIESGKVADNPPALPMKERNPDTLTKSFFENQMDCAFKTEIKITEVPSPISRRPKKAKDK